MTDKKEPESPNLAGLESFGLSENEARVYLYLLERGVEVGGSKVAFGAGLHRQYVYTALPNLLSLGLVEEVPRGKQSKYRAKPPTQLEKIAKRRTLEASDLAEQLKKISKVGYEQDFEVIVGEAAYRKYEVERAKGMKEGEKQYIISSSVDEYLEVMGDTYAYEYVPILEAKKIETFYVAPEAKRDRRSKVDTRQHFEVRILPTLKAGVVSTMVQGENVVLYVHVNPVSIYVIKSAKVAESYKDFFLTLWEMAEKVN